MFRWKFATLSGAAAVVVIATVAILAESGGIERDVEARARDALAGEATSWAAVAVDGRDVTLSGAAPEEDLRQLASTRVDRVFGVRRVDASATELLPERAPYRVALERDGDAVRVVGHAPSAPERRRMMERISRALPGLAVEDRLELARGMPDRRFLAVVDALAPAASDLASGSVVIEDRTARVEGVAASNAAFDGLWSWTPGLPAPYRLDPPRLTRPLASPFAMHVVLDEGAVTLSGYAPDAESRARLVAAAEGAHAGAVTEAIDLASGDPPGFTAAAAAAIDFLDLFASARIDMADTRIAIAGVAATPEAWRTLTSHLAAFAPKGFRVEADVGLPVVSPFTLSATTAGGKVTVTGFVPDAMSQDEIRRAAELVATPGGALVEVTFADGEPERFTEAATFSVRLLEHLFEGTVTLADRRISLAGKARTSGDLLEIEAALALETPEGFEVETSVQPPVVSPYVWAIERTEDSVVITGHVPSEQVRVAVRDAADDAIGELAVTDRTGLAAGLPEGVDLAAVAAFAATEVALLDEGRVELVDRTLSVTGRTADALAARSAREAFDARLPGGVERGRVEIDAPSPFRMVVEREPGVLIVEGNVDDEAARERLFALVDGMYGAIDLEVSLVPLGGLPEGSETVAEVVLRAASLMRSGRVEVSGTRVDITGIALTRPAVERIDTELMARLPPGFEGRADVEAPEPGDPLDAVACASRLSELSGRLDGVFAAGAGSAEDRDGAMAELAAVALDCRGLNLEVVAGGPLEPAGAEAAAAAVAAVLVEAGVAPDRIRSRGEPGAANLRVDVVDAPAAPGGPADSPSGQSAGPEATTSPEPSVDTPAPGVPEAGGPSAPPTGPATSAPGRGEEPLLPPGLDLDPPRLDLGPLPEDGDDGDGGIDADPMDG